MKKGTSYWTPYLKGFNNSYLQIEPLQGSGLLSLTSTGFNPRLFTLKSFELLKQPVLFDFNDSYVELTLV